MRPRLTKRRDGRACWPQAYLAVVEGLPQEFVEAAEKAREKARRQVSGPWQRWRVLGSAASSAPARRLASSTLHTSSSRSEQTLPSLAPAAQVIRQEKLQAQQVEHEARVKRALERAAAPVFKKAGKPVMFRSRLVKKENVSTEQQQQQDDDEELEAFLARDML